MGAFIALRRCRFGGTDYRQGDIIPAGIVLPRRISELTRIGLIASVPEQMARESDADENSRELDNSGDDSENKNDFAERGGTEEQSEQTAKPKKPRNKKQVT